MDKFSTILERLSGSYGRRAVFNDFLTCVVCCFSLGQKEEEYMEVVRRYKKDEMLIFSHALGSLINEMDDNGKGLKDVLGDYYQEYFQKDGSSQFFTPMSLSDCMAQLTIDKDQDIKTPIYDPCCGSGRIFLSAAKVNRKFTFLGADIHYQCCQMTLINMVLNGLFGKVYHMDTLRMEFFKAWEVRKEIFTGAPYIVELNVQQEIKPVKQVQEITTPAQTEKIPAQKEIFFTSVEVQEAEEVTETHEVKQKQIKFRKFRA